MSPAINPTQLTIKGFPRPRGDEPTANRLSKDLHEFSPPARG